MASNYDYRASPMTENYACESAIPTLSVRESYGTLIAHGMIHVVS